MAHEIIQIYHVSALDPYLIKVTFHTGEAKTINLSPILYGPLYGALRNWQTFKQVEVNPEVATIEWPNGADFDPETLYHWENYKQELMARALEWKHQEA
jgi:hypothetical protein